METLNQYFSEEEFVSAFDAAEISSFETIVTDSYSDAEIAKAIKSTGLTNELMCCAIQMSIVGFGNKSYGSMKYKGEIFSLEYVFRSAGVRTDLNLNSAIGSDVLTPRRLQRFFRYATKLYLERNKSASSYLFRKYTNSNGAYRTIVFPGAESCVTKADEAKYLLESYKNLDRRNKTKISERIARVLVARSILSPEESVKLISN